MPVSGEVNAPGVGRIPKKWLWVGLGGAALYVGWRYWQARGASSASTTPATTGDIGAPLEASGVVGSGGGPGNIQYAGTTTDTTPGTIATNAEWTAAVVDRLTNTGGWSAAAVYSAIGDFLGRRPLTDAEQSIVRAAIAAAGPPPQGGPYEVIPQVGAVTLTAPHGLKAVSVGKTSVDITFTPVTGAAFYYAYRSGIADNVGGSRDTKMTISGLKAGTTYKIQVAAAATTGKVGPKSSTLSVTTKK